MNIFFRTICKLIYIAVNSILNHYSLHLINFNIYFFYFKKNILHIKKLTP